MTEERVKPAKWNGAMTRLLLTPCIEAGSYRTRGAGAFPTDVWVFWLPSRHPEGLRHRNARRVDPRPRGHRFDQPGGTAHT